MAIITLPRDSLIYMDKKIMEIDIPNFSKKEINFSNIDNAKGIWSDRDIDPVRYQSEIRNEWK